METVSVAALRAMCVMPKPTAVHLVRQMAKPKPTRGSAEALAARHEHSNKDGHAAWSWAAAGDVWLHIMMPNGVRQHP